MDKLYKILANKYNLDEDIIEKIVRSEFLFAKDTIEQGGLESVHLHHLGKFGCKPRYSVIKEQHEYNINDEP